MVDSGMERYRKLVNSIKSHFPEYNVCVRRLPMSQKDYGDCLKLDDGSFRIRINRTLSPELAFEIFIHEMAHVLCWDQPGSDHGPQWGKAYSRVYRAYLKEYSKSQTI